MSAKVIILWLLIHGAVLVYGRALTECPHNDIYCNSTAMELNELFGVIKMEVSKERSSYPAKFILPAKGEDEERPLLTRFRRFPKTCNDSITPLRHTVITCWAWPNFLTCEFSCTHGYALREDGNVLMKATRNCREEENHWKPKPYFPICEPYIHCDTILVHPGNMHCEEEDGNPWHCDIECIWDGEHDAVPLKRYECRDHKYAESLPPCASLDTSRVLLEPPKDISALSQKLVSKNITEPPTQLTTIQKS